MKINGGGKGPAAEVDLYIRNKASEQRKEDAVGTAPKKEQGGGDKVQISRTGAQIQKAQEVIKSQPDVRIQKVQQAKSSIENGTYQVDGKKVASKMISENILNEIL